MIYFTQNLPKQTSTPTNLLVGGGDGGGGGVCGLWYATIIKRVNC